MEGGKERKKKKNLPSGHFFIHPHTRPDLGHSNASCIYNWLSGERCVHLAASWPFSSGRHSSNNRSPLPRPLVATPVVFKWSPTCTIRCTSGVTDCLQPKDKDKIHKSGRAFKQWLSELASRLCCNWSTVLVQACGSGSIYRAVTLKRSVFEYWTFLRLTYCSTG